MELLDKVVIAATPAAFVSSTASMSSDAACSTQVCICSVCLKRSDKNSGLYVGCTSCKGYVHYTCMNMDKKHYLHSAAMHATRMMEAGLSISQAEFEMIQESKNLNEAHEAAFVALHGSKDGCKPLNDTKYTCDGCISADPKSRSCILCPVQTDDIMMTMNHGHGYPPKIHVCCQILRSGNLSSRRYRHAQYFTDSNPYSSACMYCKDKRGLVLGCRVQNCQESTTFFHPLCATFLHGKKFHGSSLQSVPPICSLHTESIDSIPRKFVLAYCSMHADRFDNAAFKREDVMRIVQSEKDAAEAAANSPIKMSPLRQQLADIMAEEKKQQKKQQKKQSSASFSSSTETEEDEDQNNEDDHVYYIDHLGDKRRRRRRSREEEEEEEVSALSAKNPRKQARREQDESVRGEEDRKEEHLPNMTMEATRELLYVTATAAAVVEEDTAPITLTTVLDAAIPQCSTHDSSMNSADNVATIHASSEQPANESNPSQNSLDHISMAAAEDSEFRDEVIMITAWFNKCRDLCNDRIRKIRDKAAEEIAKVHADASVHESQLHLQFEAELDALRARLIARKDAAVLHAVYQVKQEHHTANQEMAIQMNILMCQYDLLSKELGSLKQEHANLTLKHALATATCDPSSTSASDSAAASAAVMHE